MRHWAKRHVVEELFLYAGLSAYIPTSVPQRLRWSSRLLIIETSYWWEFFAILNNMSANYMVPDDPAFSEQRGDPTSYGRKKTQEAGAGKISNEYLKTRQQHYRKHGVGSPLTLRAGAGTTNGANLGKHTILVPHATKKGTVYIPKATKPVEVKTIKYGRGFEDLKSALKYVNNITNEPLNPKLFTLKKNMLVLDTKIGGRVFHVRINHNPNAGYLKKYIVKLKISD
jgi:hypothetical protein